MPFDTPDQPHVRLYSRELVYTQDPDTWDGSGVDQELRITTHDSGAGNYVTIETKRWGIDRDEIQQFCDMILKALEDLE